MEFSGNGFKSYSDLLSITTINLSVSGEYHDIANCGHWIAVSLTLKNNQVSYWEKNLSMMDKSLIYETPMGLEQLFDKVLKKFWKIKL